MLGTIRRSSLHRASCTTEGWPAERTFLTLFSPDFSVFLSHKILQPSSLHLIVEARSLTEQGTRSLTSPLANTKDPSCFSLPRAGIVDILASVLRGPWGNANPLDCPASILLSHLLGLLSLICVYVRLCLHVHVYVCTHACCLCVCTCVCLFVCVCVCTCICVVPRVDINCPSLLLPTVFINRESRGGSKLMGSTWASHF